MRISKRSARPSGSERSVVVTGGQGFLGRALAAALRSAGEKNVIQADIRGSGAKCDLLDKAAVAKLLGRLRPSKIYHLAGLFSGSYEENYRLNFLAAKNILDVMIELKLSCRALLAGSAAEYGYPEKNPVPETAPLLPVTPYGFTKMMQTRLGEFYARAYGADVVIARVFNLTGPGISEALFPGRVNRQIEDLRRGATDRIKVGRLDAYRDYLPVDEAAEALRLVMGRGTPGGVYNVASGRPIRMDALLRRMLKEAGVPYSAVDAAPPDSGSHGVDKIYADISRLKKLKRSPEHDPGRPGKKDR